MTGSLNFTDPDGNTLTYSVPAQPASGTVTVTTAGVYTYTPRQAARDAAAQTEGPDFAGFTVAASDGRLGAAVTVSSVQIAPTPRQPQIPSHHGVDRGRRQTRPGGGVRDSRSTSPTPAMAR